MKLFKKISRAIQKAYGWLIFLPRRLGRKILGIAYDDNRSTDLLRERITKLEENEDYIITKLGYLNEITMHLSEGAKYAARQKKT